MEPTERPRQKGDGLRFVFIVAFSVFHLLAVVVWISPSSVIRDRILNATRQYTVVTRTWQSWALFAPDPLSINRTLIAKVTVDGGQSQEVNLTWELIQEVRTLRGTGHGKLLKGHDRLLSGEAPQYNQPFARHLCTALRPRFSGRIAQVELIREYQVMGASDRMLPAGSPGLQRANIFSYECPKELAHAGH